MPIQFNYRQLHSRRLSKHRIRLQSTGKEPNFTSHRCLRWVGIHGTQPSGRSLHYSGISTRLGRTTLNCYRGHCSGLKFASAHLHGSLPNLLDHRPGANWLHHHRRPCLLPQRWRLNGCLFRWRSSSLLLRSPLCAYGLALTRV